MDSPRETQTNKKETIKNNNETREINAITTNLLLLSVSGNE